MYLPSFEAQTSFRGKSGLVKPLPHIHRQHVAFLDVVAPLGSPLTRGSGHRGFPSRMGYKFPCRLMNHCGLKPAMRVKLAPMSFPGTAKEENPIYLGQANTSNKVGERWEKCCRGLHVLGAPQTRPTSRRPFSVSRLGGPGRLALLPRRPGRPHGVACGASHSQCAQGRRPWPDEGG